MMRIEKICSLCLKKEANHPKSHFIPRGLWKDIRMSQPQIRFQKLSQNQEFQNKRFGGDWLYDKFIYCKTCEEFFAKLDDYGCKVLRNPEQAKIILKPFRVQRPNSVAGFIKYEDYRAFELVNLDYPKFAKFVYSIFYRISVSSQPAAKHCKFDISTLEFIRNIINGQNTFSDLTLPIVVWNNYFSSSSLDHIIPSPERIVNRYSNATIFRLLVQGTAFYLLPETFAYEHYKLFLRQERPIIHEMKVGEFESLVKRYVLEFF